MKEKIKESLMNKLNTGESMNLDESLSTLEMGKKDLKSVDKFVKDLEKELDNMLSPRVREISKKYDIDIKSSYARMDIEFGFIEFVYEFAEPGDISKIGEREFDTWNGTEASERIMYDLAHRLEYKLM